jgi:cytochrome P450
MITPLLLIFISIVLVVLLLARKFAYWPKSPPGPPIYPLIGSLPTMARLSPVPYRAFHALSQTYGPIVRTVLGIRSLVILSRYEDIKEVMNNEALDDRVRNTVAYLIIFGDDGDTKSAAVPFFNNTVVASSIDTRMRWREIRRFMLKSLRDLGFAKAASEQAILDESALLVKIINKRIAVMGGHVSLDKVFNSAALNIVWNLIAAERFDYDDQKMLQLMEYVDNFMQLGKDVIGKPLSMIPALRFVPPYRGLVNRLSARLAAFRDFISSAVATRKGLYDCQDPACYIDMFLNRAAEDETGVFTERQLIYNCIELFLAGSETTSKSLQYAVACLILHPEVQDRIQAELDCCVAAAGGGRQQITIADRPRLPYVEATLHEVWRYCHVVPVQPPRHVRQELSLGKYSIPPGTALLYNTYSLHMDEAYWGDPHRFRPERFLTNQGTFAADERIFPFGIGRRRCLGESLARMENFLFFANVLLNFRFRQGENPAPSLEPEVGFTNGPYPFRMEITARL